MYKDETGTDVNGTFYQQYLTALNNLTALCLEKASVHDAADALWRCVADFLPMCDIICFSMHPLYVYTLLGWLDIALDFSPLCSPNFIVFWQKMS